MSSKSTEELLNLVNTTEPSPELDEVQQFIADYEIEHSDTDKVPALHVYWFYMKWKVAGNGMEGILNRWQFFTRFSKCFQQGRHRVVFYKIKKERFMVSKEEKAEIRADFDAERKRVRWQKAKAKWRKSQKRKGILGNTQD